jgi:hypothetical protein
MPGFLLHLGAMVKCAHGGDAKPTAPNPRVMVDHQPVATMGAPWVVAGCAMPPPIAGNGPCVTAMFTTPATRVFVDKKPVLLMDAQAVCVPTGTPVLTTKTQTKVMGK